MNADQFNRWLADRAEERKLAAEPVPPTSLGWCRPCLDNDGELVPAVTEWHDGHAL